MTPLAPVGQTTYSGAVPIEKVMALFWICDEPRLAAQGGGVALGRKSLAGHALASGRLIAPFGLAVPIDEAFHLIQPAGSGRHPDADAFVDWLLEVIGRGDQSSNPRTRKAADPS